MKSVKVAAMVALLAGTVALGQSVITFQVEVGGINNAAGWEAGGTPLFTSGVTDGSGLTVDNGSDLTWAVRATVSGTHQNPGGAGDALAPIGAANLVFDVVVKKDGVPVAFGAAPMTCATGTPGDGSATVCAPTDAGFYSTINDGDADGSRIDALANGSFAMSLAGGKRVIDPVPTAPNMDYGWYPTAMNRGGIPLTGGTPATTTTATGGELLGFGAGYKNYDFGVTYLAGVGMSGPLGYYGTGECGNGFGTDLPLFEGQINTAGLAEGAYTIEVVPSATGNNILHGSIDCYTQTFGSDGVVNYGSFAVQANQVVGTSTTFNVGPGGATLVGRNIFYNQSAWDGNSGAATVADDAAIATDKSPYLAGTGAAKFVNYISYNRSINGIMVDIANLPAGYTVTAADFEFKTGNNNTPNTWAAAPAPTSVSQRIVGGNTRVTVIFANTAIGNSKWLQVKVLAAGIGLAADDVHYWGVAYGESGNSVTLADVNATDINGAKNNPKALQSAPIDFKFDYNRDKNVNATDQNIAKNNATSLLTRLNLINIP